MNKQDKSRWQRLFAGQLSKNLFAGQALAAEDMRHVFSRSRLAIVKRFPGIFIIKALLADLVQTLNYRIKQEKAYVLSKLPGLQHVTD